jgi:methionyl aminopeptidase
MITFKTPEDIEIMAVGGKKLADVLAALKIATKVGVVTKDLDTLARDLIIASDARPAFLNYHPAGARNPYPWTLCVSLNDVVVHGQPSDYALQDGDLVKLDLGLKYKEWYLDAAITVGVGKISEEAMKLMAATKEALAAGIAAARIGNTFGDLGHAIESVVREYGFSVADDLIGHGIGRNLHEDPPVWNFGREGDGEPIEEGMVIAIEPMVCAGFGAVKTLKIDESYATRDGSLAAHFEHTVAITKQGSRILTEV